MTQLTPELLLNAYAVGIFPMAEARDDPELYWIDPERRGILPLDGFHVPRSLRRTIKRAPFEIRVDTAFREVVAGCAARAPDRPESWINDEIQAVYGALFDGGHAHSVECWQDGLPKYAQVGARMQQLRQQAYGASGMSGGAIRPVACADSSAFDRNPAAGLSAISSA